MFMMEGIPAIVLGIVVLRTLAETPHEAKWLGSSERDWLLATLATEREAEAIVPQRNFWAVVFSGRIWLLSVVYFGVSTTMYGVSLWLPTVIQSFSGLGDFATGLIAVLPYFVTVLVMVLVGMRSDRSGERRWHTAGSAFIAAVGLAIAAYGHSTIVVVAGLGMGLAFAEGMCGPFWAMATSSMTGLSAAAGIAMINSLANLGGYYGQYIVGFFRSQGGGFRGGLLAIAATVAISGGVAVIVGRPPSNKPKDIPT
jgi:ACS family tartrate transporter-like MFS transporter